MTHRNLILAGILAALLSGCGLMTPAQQDASDDGTCKAQTDYKACRERLMEYRRTRALSQSGR